MNIFALGLDQLALNELKQAGYTAVALREMPDTEQARGAMLLITGEKATPGELAVLRRRCPDTVLVYVHTRRGVRGYQAVHLLCESLGIHFLPPRSTPAAIADKIRYALGQEEAKLGNVIGFFGSGPGIGCTTAAHLMAARMAAVGQRVLMLGMNVYDPGYDRRPPVSLDRLRSRITGKIIGEEDFRHWVSLDGYRYLPGNFDYLAAQDYREEEMEYLLETASKHADVVIADFGSIPESAAWYAGMRGSSLRLMVTRPSHEYRLEHLLDLADQLDVKRSHVQLLACRRQGEDVAPPKQLALRLGCELLLELPLLDIQQGGLQTGKKELQQLDEKVRQLLVALGRMPETRRREMP